MPDSRESKVLRNVLMQDESAIDIERKILMHIETKRRRLGRIRWAVWIAWCLFVGLFAIAGVAESIGGRTALSSSVAAIAMATFWIALFFTASWYVRHVSLKFDSIEQALAAIQERLDEGLSGNTQQ